MTHPYPSFGNPTKISCYNVSNAEATLAGMKSFSVTKSCLKIGGPFRHNQSMQKDSHTALYVCASEEKNGGTQREGGLPTYTGEVCFYFDRLNNEKRTSVRGNW